MPVFSYVSFINRHRVNCLANKYQIKDGSSLFYRKEEQSICIVLFRFVVRVIILALIVIPCALPLLLIEEEMIGSYIGFMFIDVLIPFLALSVFLLIGLYDKFVHHIENCLQII